MKQLQEDVIEVKAFLKKKIYTEEFAKEFLAALEKKMPKKTHIAIVEIVKGL